MTAYNMPGFSLRGTVVASYAAFSKQAELYVLAPAIAEHANQTRQAVARRVLEILDVLRRMNQR